MTEDMIKALADTPTTLLFAWFLWLTFRQRNETMRIFAEMTKMTMESISACCDDVRKDDGGGR